MGYRKLRRVLHQFVLGLLAIAALALGATSAYAQSTADIFYIYADHLNTPRVITNNVGQPVWRWDNVDPFGANAPNENPGGLGIFTCNLRFPGQYFDRETGLHYNYFRDYDPGIGRYVESDPIGLRGGTNTYLYVLANPLTSIDPIGWRTFKVCGAENGPKFPDNFGPYRFTQACRDHDACYDDCEKRPSKAACDSMFFGDTQRLCRDIPWFWIVLGAQRDCYTYSLEYSLGVELRGQKAFDDARAKCSACIK
jgi:RHS repeat-associated protein